MPQNQSNYSQRTRTSAYCSKKSSLIPEIVRDHIQSLVGRNDLKRSSTLLLELVKMYAPNLNNEVAIIRRRIVEVEKMNQLNVLEFEQISKERNRLGLAILDLADMICEF